MVRRPARRAPSAAATLDKNYNDADGDLVADPPTDAAKLLDPEEINFSYVASSDTEDEEETWKEFLAALERTLGRKVNLVTYTDAGEQMRALKDGELHVTAFGTGEVAGRRQRSRLRARWPASPTRTASTTTR